MAKDKEDRDDLRTRIIPADPKPPKADQKAPELSDFNPVATMQKTVDERAEAEAEEKARKESEESAKAAKGDDREPSAYVVSHAAVGPHGRGDRVRAEQLIPVPKDAKEDEAKRLREDGIRRLVDLGAVTPVYEDKKEQG